MGKLKVLVLGDGLLGKEIVKQTSWDFMSRRTTSFSIDCNFSEIIDPTYNVIVNCIANTNTYSNDKSSHWEVNYKFVHNLIKFCNQNRIKLVHISTDYLYAGSKSNASEDDVPLHCNSWYGYTKLLADGLVQLTSDKYLLCRCTHKPNPFPYENAWVDQIGNFDYVDEISSIIIKLITCEIDGLYNVGTDIKSIYELAKKTKPLVGKILAPYNIPKNQTMNLDKLNKVLNL